MQDYKKRAKGSWGYGKNEKSGSNRSERTYIKKVLHNQELTSVIQESVSIKREIDEEDYDRKTFLEYIEGRPDMIISMSIQNVNKTKKKKKKKNPTLRSAKGLLEYAEKKIREVNDESYASCWLKRYYNSKINKMRELIKKLEDSKK
jgi:hypothetical protein